MLRIEDSLVCGYNLNRIDLYLAPGCLICGRCKRIFTRSKICYHVDICFHHKPIPGEIIPVDDNTDESGEIYIDENDEFPLNIILSNVRFVFYTIYFFIFINFFI